MQSVRYLPVFKNLLQITRPWPYLGISPGAGKQFPSVKMKLKWKDRKGKVWLGFCLSQELSDNLLNCCFMQWDFADCVKTACRQLNFLARKCVLNGFSVWSFFWIKFCSVLALVSFHLEFGRRGVVNENASCLCTFLCTQKRQNMN